MPIHYASILNQRSFVVLRGMYSRTETDFKSQVQQNSNMISRFGFSEANLQSNLRILYHNWDSVTAAIVVSHEVDKQECQEFLEQFKSFVEIQCLGK